MPKSVIFGYARVSTKQQKTDRQKAELMKHITSSRYYYEDVGSGASMKRDNYLAMKDRIESGDVLYIHELDRLGRNKSEVLKELQYYQDNNITVRILNIPSTLTDYAAAYGDSKIAQDIFEAVNKMMLEVLAAFAEAERTMNYKRQKEGIEAARKKGVHMGRPALKKPETWDEDIKAWKAGECSAVSLWRDKYKMSKSAFYKLLNPKK